MGIEHVDEIKMLVESGDIELSHYRKMYKDTYGTTSTVSDDKIIELIAIHEEDDGMQDETVAAMHTAQAG